MNAVQTFLARRASDAGFYCPACRSHGLTADDMDLARDWQHSEAMRAKYAAVCCKGCADDHITTVEGDCLPTDRAFYSRDLGQWFSSDDARQEAEAEADFDARDWDAERRVMAGWR